MTISIRDVLPPPLSVVKNIFRVDKLPAGQSFSLRQRLINMNYHYIRLRLRYSKCHVETNWPGSDEIAIGGIAIYPDFRTKSFYKSLGDYDEGTKKERNVNLVGMSMWGTKHNAWDIPGLGIVPHPFSVNPAKSGIPKYFGAIVTIAETDFGGFKQWINEDLKVAVDNWIMSVKIGICTEIMLSNGQIPSNSDMKDYYSSEWISTFVMDAFKNMLFERISPWGDSVFKPTSAGIFTHIESYAEFPTSERGDQRNNSENRERHFKLDEIGDDAHYELHLDWQMYK